MISVQTIMQNLSPTSQTMPTDIQHIDVDSLQTGFLIFSHKNVFWFKFPELYS